jgi:protein-tyrosine phosphatase
VSERGASEPMEIDVRRARSVNFVCLGNICRSPMAQGVFEHLASQRGVRSQLTIISSGTGHWHIGDPPDPRTIAVAAARGITLRSLGQQIDPAKHFQSIDLHLAMDRSNYANLRRLGCPESRLAMCMHWADRAAPEVRALGDNLEVPDPYHGLARDFEHVYRLVDLGARGLLDAMFATEAKR